MLKGACRRRTYRRRTRVEWSGAEWGGLAIHSFIHSTHGDETWQTCGRKIDVQAYHTKH